MSFWETFNDASDVGITTMGEDVVIGGETVSGVVDPLDYQEGSAPGGRRTIISCKVLLSASVVLSDGMTASVRGLDGKVDGWQAQGPQHNLVAIGPVNRWSGEIPGV